MKKKIFNLTLPNGEDIVGISLTPAQLVDMHLPPDLCLTNGVTDEGKRCIYMGPTFNDRRMSPITRSLFLNIEYAFMMGASTQLEADLKAIEIKGMSKFESSMKSYYEVRNKYSIKKLSDVEITELTRERIDSVKSK